MSPRVQIGVFSVPIRQAIGRIGDPYDIRRGQKNHRKPERGKAKQEGREQHEEVSPKQDAESRDIMMLVQMAEAGHDAQGGCNFIAVDRLPRLEKFIHGDVG